MQSKVLWFLSIPLIIALLLLGFFRLSFPEKIIKVTGSTAWQGTHQSTSFDGKALVVWTEYRKSKVADIYAQLIDDSGSKLWGADGKLINETAKDKLQIRLAADKSSAYISWIENNGYENDIYLQKVDKDGELWTKPTAVAIGRSDQNNQQLSVTDDGILLAWQEYSSQGYVKVQLFDKSSGKAIWPNAVLVADSTHLQAEPRILDVQGSWIIAWQQQSEELSSNIFAQKIDKTGKLLWGKSGIALTEGLENKEDVSLAADGKGGFYVVWENIVAQNNIFAQHVDKEGKVSWDKKGVPLSLADRIRWHPTALILEDRLTVVWKEEHRDDDVYAQQFSDAGKRLWGNEGIALSSADKDQAFISGIVNRNKEQIIAVWQDARKGGSDVFGQIIDTKGKSLLSQDGDLIYEEKGFTQIEPLVTLMSPNKALVSWLKEASETRGQLLSTILEIK